MVVIDLKDSRHIIPEPRKLVIIDFYADWCGPCKRIAPEYKQLSEKYSQVEFYKVNIDNTEEYTEYKVKSLPTFLFLDGELEIGRIEGANINALEQAIEMVLKKYF